MALQIEIGNGEFGEVYHLLTAAYLLQERSPSDRAAIGIRFVKFDRGRELFDFLEVKVFEPVGKCGDKPRATANVIHEYFHDGCLEKLAEAIREAGKNQGWDFPYPSLATADRKLIIWQRNKEYKPQRNSSVKLVEQLVDLCRLHDTIPVVLGARRGLTGAAELGAFYDENPFFSERSIPKQLWFIDQLFRSYGALANVGMMSASMDGPAMIFGHKTVYFARHRDATPRMQKVSIAVPNLVWQRVEYEGSFQKLSDAQLRDLEQNVWPAD